MERTDAFTKETRRMLEEEILKFPVEKMQDPMGGFYGHIKLTRPLLRRLF